VQQVAVAIAMESVVTRPAMGVIGPGPGVDRVVPGIARRPEALSDVSEALTISRETGMAFIGPMILGILALTADDPRARNEALAEGEALLASGSPSHNHLQFRRGAIDACLDAEDWSGAEFHSNALETYTHEEPLPWSGFFVARGRALAACGRGRRDAALMA
jgi:hypothetical protein